MYSGYNKIFWGIFIATFSINIGSFKILPSFVGFWIILNGISLLYNETKLDLFRKAKVYGVIAVFQTTIGWILNLFFPNIFNFLLFNIIWMTLFPVIEMFLFYKLIEGSIEYFNINSYYEIANDSVMKARFYLVLSIVSIILFSINQILNIFALNILIIIVFIVLRVYLMILSRSYRNIFASNS